MIRCRTVSKVFPDPRNPAEAVFCDRAIDGRANGPDAVYRIISI
jgi:hypothetical protein